MDTTITLLKTLLQTKLQGKIKSFYVGDPILIPDSALPCISISPNSTSTDIADNQRDIHTHKIDISLIVDARQFFGKMPNEMVGTSYLMETMSKENTDGSLNSNSILGVIRDNLSLATNRFISNQVSIDYTTRRRTEDLITIETIASIEVQQIGNR